MYLPGQLRPSFWKDQEEVAIDSVVCSNNGEVLRDSWFYHRYRQFNLKQELQRGDLEVV
jgi:hypothetical protein